MIAIRSSVHFQSPRGCLQIENRTPVTPKPMHETRVMATSTQLFGMMLL